MGDRRLIQGAGGGGKGGSKGNAPNSLRSGATVRIVDLLGEGEIKGLVNGAKSIYFDNTPLQDSFGNFNFEGITWDMRYGLPDQHYIEGFNSVESEQPVSIEVKKGTPIIQTVTGEDLDAVRLTATIPALAKQDSEDGSLQKNSVQFYFEVRYVGGEWSNVTGIQTIKGKCTSAYDKSYLVPLPRNPSGVTTSWEIRMVRVTDDSKDAIKNQNATYFGSITKITYGKFTYPYSAYIAMTVSAEQFGQSIPERSYEVYGRIIQVPSNYDPVSRAYTGVWNGTFKWAWTDNPAWVLYDILQDDRFGLGDYIPVEQIDKWGLYEIAQYCDQLVPDGLGGMKPRFTFNGCITTQSEAFDAISSVASTFRGMAFWSSGSVMATQDRPTDVSILAASSNTVEGSFTYQGSALKARHTVAIVKWNNPALNYEQDYVVVEDPEGLARYGYRETEIEAFGCTDRAQAIRLGEWALFTELNETQVIGYTAGLDHAGIRPGDIVAVQDPSIAGVENAGRLSTGNTATVLKLDRNVTFQSGNTYSISVMLPNGRVQEKNVVVSSYGVPTKTVTVSSAFDVAPEHETVWVLSASNLTPSLWKVLSLRETANHTYEVSATQHEPAKFAHIDNSARFDPLPVAGNEAVQPPTGLDIKETLHTREGVATTSLLFSWQSPGIQSVVVAYDVSYEGPNGFVGLGTIQSTSVTIDSAPAGEYTFYVNSVGFNNRRSVVVSKDFLTEGWKASAQGTVQNLRLKGKARTETVFESANPEFEWENNWTGVVLREDGTNPVHRCNVVKIFDATADQLLRTEYVTDTRYTYTLEKNRQDNTTYGRGPSRSIRVEVAIQDVFNRITNAMTLTVSNPPPMAVTPQGLPGIGQFSVRWAPLTEPDLSGYIAWVSTTSGFNPLTTDPYYDGNGNAFTYGTDSSNPYFVRVAAYDSFGKEGLNISGEIEVSAITSIDTTPPDVPTGLAMASSASTIDPLTGLVEVTISWDANTEADLAGYILFVREGNTGTFTPYNVYENSYKVKVRPASVVQASILAFDNNWNKSAQSAVVSHTAAKDTVAPAKPTGLVASGTFNGVWLNWNANTEVDLSHYEIFETASASTTPVAATAPTFTTTSLILWRGDLPSGVKRYYFLRAVDTSGNKSVWSDKAEATTLGIDAGVVPPSKVTNLTATSELIVQGAGNLSASVIASWTAVDKVVAYEVAVSADGGNEVVSISPVESFGFTGLPGVTYNIRVRAIGTTGLRGEYSDTLQHVAAVSNQRVEQPVLLSATAGLDASWLSWSNGSTTNYALTSTNLASGNANGHSVTNAVRTANAAEAPDGSGRATLVVENVNAALQTHYHTTSVNMTGYNLLPGTELWSSIYLKKVENGRRYVTIDTPNYANQIVRGQLYLDLETGLEYRAPTKVGDFRYKIEILPNGWLRVSMKQTYGGNGSIGIRVYSYATSTSTATSAGDGTPMFYMFGAQLEVGYKASPFIETALSPVTVAAEPASDFKNVSVYYNVTNNFDTALKLADVVGTSFAHTGLQPKTTYFYWLIARNTSGVVSLPSVPMSTTTGAIPEVDLPTVDGITFLPNQGTNKNRLDWTAGTITYAGGTLSRSIAAGTITWTTGTLYVYYKRGDTALSTTTNIGSMYLDNGILLGVYKGGTLFQLVQGREYIDGGMVLAQTIGANQLVTNTAVITGAAQIANAIISDAHISTLSAAKLTAGSALAATITVSGSALSTIKGNAELGAQDPATRVNAGTTRIDPGKIVVSGTTTLADWRGTSDTTTINGGKIETSSITARSLLLTDNTNLIVNGDFADTTNITDYFVRSSGATMEYAEDAAGALTGVRYIKLSKTTLSHNMYATGKDFFPVIPGEALYGETAFKASADTNGGAYFQLVWYDKNKAAITPATTAFVNNAKALAASWTTYGGQIVVPANAFFAKVRFYNNTNNAQANDIYYDRLIVRRANAASLIVDGSISASKLVIGNTDNIVPDPLMADIVSWGNHTQIGTTTVGWSTEQLDGNAVNSFRLYRSVTGGDLVRQGPSTKDITVTGGQSLVGSVNIYVDVAPTANPYATMRYYFYDAAGTLLSTVEGGQLSKAELVAGVGTWLSLPYKAVTVPAGATTVKVRAAIVYTGNTDQAVYFIGRHFLRTGVGTVLIEDGAVTASKLIATEAVITGTAQIKDAIITSAKIVELDASKITAGSILSGSIVVSGRSIGAVAQSAEVFDNFSQDWLYHAGTANGFDYATSAADVQSGDRSFWSKAVDSVWSRSPDKVPFDPTKLYKLTYKVRKNAGTTGNYYLGVVAFAQDGTTFVNSSGGNAGSNQYYPVKSNAPQSELTATFQEFSGYIKGTSAASLGNGTLANPVRLHTNARFFSPLTIFNYTTGDSRIVVDSVKIEVVDENAASVINAGTTTIDPGKILISGTSTLADWRNGADATSIEGGKIAANTITANKLEIGARGISIEGITFSYNKATNVVSWTAGIIRYTRVDGTAGGDPDGYVGVSAGSTTWTTGTLFIYWNKGATDPANGATVALVSTTVAATANGTNTLVLGTYKGGTNFIANYGQTIIDGTTIFTGTITATQIAANAITAEKIAAGTISGDHIAANTISAKNMILSDMSNMAGNGWDEGDRSAWTAPSVLDWYYGAISGGGITTSGWKLSSMARDIAYSKEIATNQGDVFYVEAWCYNEDPNWANLMVRFKLQDGTYVWPAGANTNVKNTWVLMKGQVVAPANAVAACMYLQVNKTAGQGNRCIYSKPVMRRAANAELIVDGAITANKISVSSLSAISANLGNVNIDAARINSGIINVARIGDLTVDTIKITSGAISASASAATATTSDTTSDPNVWYDTGLWLGVTNVVSFPVDVIIDYNLDLKGINSTFGMGGAYIRVLRNGEVVRQFYIQITSTNTYSTNFKEEFMDWWAPAGSLTYNVQIQRTMNNTLVRSQSRMIGAKVTKR